MIRIEFEKNPALVQWNTAAATAEHCLKAAGKFLPSFTIRLHFEDVGADGAFRFHFSDGTASISGREEGVRCGLYTLLNELGIHWFNPAEEIVLPSAPVRVNLEKLNGLHTPDFPYRGLHICAGEHHYDDRVGKWMSFNRMNRKLTHFPEETVIGTRLRELGLRPDTTVHAYELLIPDAKYFPANPDFFALIGGRRIRQSEGGQLCLSNHKMREAFAAELLALIRQKPDIGVFGFCPNDGYGHCECPECAALDTADDRKNHTVNGRVADFVRDICERIARTAPGIMLGHYSYSNFSDFMELFENPPKNLLISFTQFHCFRHSVADSRCEKNQVLEKRFRHIRSKVENVYLYDYYSYRWSGLPAPIWDAQCADFKDWKEQNVNGFLSEASGADHESWSSFWPAYYIAARMLWNTGESRETIFTEICGTRYGKASETMNAYFDTLQKSVNSMNHCFCKEPEDFLLFFTPEIRRQCAGLLKEAEMKEPENELLKREKALFDRWCENAESRNRYLCDSIITARNLKESPDFKPQKICLVQQNSQLPDLTNDTEVEVAADKEMIRFRIRLHESMTGTMKYPSEPGKIFGCENLELFLNDGLDPEKCYHYLIGISGNSAASECVASRWNWAWKHHAEIKTNSDPGGWNIEIILPKKDINASAAFAFSVVRNRYADGSWQILGAPGGGAFFQTKKYIQVQQHTGNP